MQLIIRRVSKHLLCVLIVSTFIYYQLKLYILAHCFKKFQVYHPSIHDLPHLIIQIALKPFLVWRTLGSSRNNGIFGVVEFSNCLNYIKQSYALGLTIDIVLISQKKCGDRKGFLQFELWVNYTKSLKLSIMKFINSTWLSNFFQISFFIIRPCFLVHRWHKKKHLFSLKAIFWFMLYGQ